MTSNIALKYILFALIATAVNLIFQSLSLFLIESLYLAILNGTATGLVCKYILDKKYIFYHNPESKTKDMQKFMSYTLTGVITTFIFWGTEITFDWFLKVEWAKYLGAIIGLSMGYMVKYQLDKKYVFNTVPS